MPDLRHYNATLATIERIRRALDVALGDLLEIIPDPPHVVSTWWLDSLTRLGPPPPASPLEIIPDPPKRKSKAKKKKS